MVILKEISAYMEEIASLSLAEEWDNPGLLLGGMSDEVKKIMVCLDITSEVVKEAVHKDVDLIISHHPVIFKPLKRVVKDDFKGKILYELIKNNIGVYSAHTNLDVASKGLNDYLARLLGLSNIQNLNMLKFHLYEEVAYNINPLGIKGEEYGLGKVGTIDPSCTCSEFIERLKESLDVEHVKVIGNVPAKVQKAAVFCGGFDGNLSGLLRERPDILVTGDIKHNDAVDFSEMGFCVIDAGHYSTEIIVKDLIVKLIEKKFKNIDVFKSEWEKNPAQFA